MLWLLWCRCQSIISNWPVIKLPWDNIDIEEFYFRYIVITGLASLPIIGTYIIDKNPNIVDKISPFIAKLFSPIVLITLFIYIGSIIFFGSNIYNDRDFLLLFNGVLIAVMALIFFSITEGLSTTMGKIEISILFICHYSQ